MTHDDAGEALRVQARALWQRVETIHAVTYFASESTAASSEVGVHGFWRTYFGFRAAPFGRCSAATVTSAFYGFSPTFVERAVPAIWGLSTPQRSSRSAHHRPPLLCAGLLLVSNTSPTSPR